MKPGHLILLLVMNFFWAGIYAANKVIGRNLPPEDVVGGIVTLRFGLAALCLLAVWPWSRGPAPRGRDLVTTCIMGLLVCVVGQRLQVYANQIGTAGNSAVLMSVEPLLTSVAAAIFLRERLGPRRLAGFALGMGGVVLLNAGRRAEFHWTGLGPSLIFVSSFVCEAAYSLAGKPLMERASVAKMLAISLVAGTVVNLAIDGRTTLTVVRALSLTAWLLLVGQAVICTALGYFVWFVVIKECPVSVAALTIFAQSVFGVAIAAVWLGEPLHWGQLWGGLVIVAGLVVGLSRQVGKAAAEQGKSPGSAPP